MLKNVRVASTSLPAYDGTGAEPPNRDTTHEENEQWDISKERQPS
jgi:hypothetical protein